MLEFKYKNRISVIIALAASDDTGRWYFLETATESSVPYGSCYINTITPDGLIVVDDFGPYGQCIYARPSKEVSEEKYMERKGDFDRLRQHKGILPGHQLFD